MRHPLGEEKEVKKRREKVAARQNSESETDPHATDILPEDIDPADFFDPEEFGVRRRLSRGA